MVNKWKWNSWASLDNGINYIVILIDLLDATNNEESNDEKMELEPQDYKTDDEDEEYTSSLMIYLLGLKISSKTYVEQ